MSPSAVPPIRIGSAFVGPGSPVWIIAEAGVNHNGDPSLAFELVRAAASAGADAVKFQLFRAEDVVTAAAPKARYQLETTDPGESQFEMLKSLEVPRNTYPELMREASSLGIEFLCTCYSPAEIDFLDDMGVPAFKFASALIIELPLIRRAAEKGRPVLLSTGMATMTEVRDAVRAVEESGADVALLQCTTDYPADPADANLRAIDTLVEEFRVPVGYSDHTLGDVTTLAAVACGATFIEKHLTLDNMMSGPDHVASLEPSAFAEMVRRVREVEAALGTGKKEPTSRELENALTMRRSLVAAQTIPAGTAITAELVTAKRPASGLPPSALETIVGARARVDIPANAPLTLDLLDGTS
jgi:N,N'-diacetyllegionaminate synthase